MGACWTAVLTVCAAGVAHAQTGTTTPSYGTTAAQTYGTTDSSGSSHWSVDSGETVGSGQNVLRGQVGFPGLWGDFIHGIDPTTEIGGRLKINYGVEGLTSSTNFEMAAQFLARKQFVDTGKVKFALRFDPGILFYTAFSTTTFGITFPIEAQVGFPINDQVILNGSFALPMWVTFGTFGTFYIPIMFGGGVEYKIQSNLVLTFKLAMGPTLATAGGSSFTLDALFGVAWRM
jgi:hypothetical protein